MEERLVGTWIWVETTGGAENEIKDPDSSGRTMTLEFTSTGNYALLTSDNLGNAGDYEIVSRNSKLLDRRVEFLLLGDNEPKILMLDKDRMELKEDQENGITTIYVRD
ncbi:hypothetical protein [Croceiramulus getboli]|nr:hypothetical protein P8624_06715 [Flavobacteriaceae bacterium YJPT1-3]